MPRLRRSEWARPRHARLIRLRRALGRTRLGYAVKQGLRGRRLSDARPRRAAPGEHRRVAEPRRASAESLNALLVSHCDFTGNSALHVYSIARELERRGLRPAIAVPGHAGGVDDLGCPAFPVLSYRDVRKRRLTFRDGRGVDIVHAFTPREHVREFVDGFVGVHGCPYVVHLEDNEGAIVAGRSHPVRAPEFLAGAAGVTVVVDRLLELKPDGIPGVVVWPGFDEAVLSPGRSREEVRDKLRLGPGDLALAYPGNVHDSNLEEMRSLYLAILQLRAAGYPAVLVKTGWNFVHRSRLPKLGDGIRELGWVARAHVPELLGAADALVQPGRPNPFNDYRFPSKLPEFLASGRPVVLPRTNIGLHLEDGVEALLLDGGDADEICDKVALLAADPELRRTIGKRGRAFALRELRWSRVASRVAELYRLVEGQREALGVTRRRPCARP